MSTTQRIFLFFLLPLVAPLIVPPRTLLNDAELALLPVTIGVSACLVGFLVNRGSSTALRLAMFLQGLNVVIRLMMFFPHMLFISGGVNYLWIITSILSIALSLYLLLRLDQTDVRVMMVT